MCSLMSKGPASEDQFLWINLGGFEVFVWDELANSITLTQLLDPQIRVPHCRQTKLASFMLLFLPQDPLGCFHVPKENTPNPVTDYASKSKFSWSTANHVQFTSVYGYFHPVPK